MGGRKEMDENGLDAKATRIEVNINQGGTELILSLIHISDPTRHAASSYAVSCFHNKPP